jgi:uncharacterized protein YqeY
MSLLKQRIQDDMKAAMRARETQRLGTIRLLLAACKQREVDDRVELDDAAILAIVERLVKQRKDSIAAFQAAGREDLVATETAEMQILQTYLPPQLTEQEISSEVEAALVDVGATGPADMGRAMGAAKSRLAGKADMAAVSRAVKEALAARAAGKPSS